MGIYQVAVYNFEITPADIFDLPDNLVIAVYTNNHKYYEVWAWLNEKPVKIIKNAKDYHVAVDIIKEEFCN